MRSADFLSLALGSVAAHRMRSLLTALGIAVGIAAVVLLTSIGEGVHRFVLGEFTQFGTHLIAVTPGKTSTFGLSGAVINTVRPLTLEDAEALARLPRIEAALPFVQGNAPIEYGNRIRRSMIFGTGADVPRVWRMQPRIGRFLPREDPRHARPFAVLGAKVKQELFGAASPLGRRVRIGGERYRVIGVMEPKGTLLGFDLDDAVYIPTHRAMAMFDQEGVMEVDLLYAPGGDSASLTDTIRTRLKQRHGGEDFTIITQDQ
ncbi:MAG: peptide ABC transporter permease, partial [Candidatus Sedimenticola endophacoides]